MVLGPSNMWIRYHGQGIFNVWRELYDVTGTKVGEFEELGDLGTFGNNGLAPLDNKQGPVRVGYIDTTGNYVFDYRFKDGGDFADNGLAAVENTEELWGYIDATGKYVIEPQFKYAEKFSDGLAPVEITEDHWAYIRENGEIAFKIDCDFAEEFVNGCAIIHLDLDIRFLVLLIL